MGAARSASGRARVEPFDTNDRLHFLDYNDAAVAAQTPFSREELDREMHVRAPDGTWHAASTRGLSCCACCLC